MNAANRPLLHVLAAEYAGGHVLRVRFNNGAVKLVDLSGLAKEGGVFEPLADLAEFRKFFIDLNTVCWPSGADVAPEYLHSLGKDIPAARKVESVPA